MLRLEAPPEDGAVYCETIMQYYLDIHIDILFVEVLQTWVER